MYFSATFFTAFHVNQCFGFEISLEETVHSWKLIPYSLLAANGFLPSLNANCIVTTGDANITAILNHVMYPPNTVQFLIPFLGGRETEQQKMRLHLKLWFTEFSNKKPQHSWLTVTLGDTNSSPVLLNHYCFLKNFFIISIFFSGTQECLPFQPSVLSPIIPTRWQCSWEKTT